MGRDGKRCQTIYFFIYVTSGMGSATQGMVLDPCPHVPILPNTAETYLGPQLPLCPQEPGMESGLQGTHSGPDSSSVACTGSLVPRSKGPVLGELTVADKDADLNMPVLLTFQAVHGEDSPLAASFQSLETAVPFPAGSLHRLTGGVWSAA